MKARILFPLLALCCFAGCGDLVAVLDSGFIKDNEEDLRHCVGGEWVGRLPKTSTPHHCEKRIFYTDLPSYYTFNSDQGASGEVEVTGLFGYLAGELGVSTSTRMTGKLAALRRWIAVHEEQKDCNQHDSVCQDEYVVRMWNLAGKVLIHATATGTAQVSLEKTAEGEGVPLQAGLVLRGNRQLTEITVGPVLLCESAEHADCANRGNEDPGGAVLTIGPDGGYLEAPWHSWDGGTVGTPTIPLPPDWSSEEEVPERPRDGGSP